MKNERLFRERERERNDFFCRIEYDYRGGTKIKQLISR